MAGDAKVTVKEIGVKADNVNQPFENQYEINCEVTNSSGDQMDHEKVDGGVSFTTPPAGSAIVTVTNRATFTQKVTLSKHFMGTGENNPAPNGFQATFSVYEVVDGVQSEKPIGLVNYNEFTNGSYELWLEEGKQYNIVETVINEGKAGVAEYLYTTVQVNAKPANRGTTGTVTLPQASREQTVDFVNYYGDPTGALSITKEVWRTDTNSPSNEGEFEFEITVPGANAEYNTTYTTIAEDSPKHTGNVNFGVDGKASVKLYAGETITIEGLPTGVQAIITEKNHDGYAPEWSADIATATPGASTTTDAITPTKTVAVTCTNRTGAVLPSTGGMGTTPFLALGTLLTLGAGMLLVQRRRKEGSDAV